jgi:hypothetical protein
MRVAEVRPTGNISVLRVDPDLAADLPALQRAAALARLRAPTIRVEPGTWTPPDQPESDFGLLVVDGVLGRDVVLSGIGCSELLAPGDLLRASPPHDEDRFVAMGLDWWVVEPATIAVLDEDFAAAALSWPPVVAALIARAVRQTESSAMHLAITCLRGVGLRLRVLFWHLAGRLGRVGSEGVVVPLALTHALLARLIRARRPAVTIALGELREQGLVLRREDRSWLLRGGPPEELSRSAEAYDGRPLS